MSNSFVNAARGNATPRKPKVTLTENADLTHTSTGEAVLDFFAKSGALRGSPDAFANLWYEGFNEDPQLALRALFNARDIRHGKGERANFRHVMAKLALNHNEPWYANCVAQTPEYGRWDDLWPLLDTPARHTVTDLVAAVLHEDSRAMKAGEPISLLGKWMPRENTSSKQTVHYAKIFIEELALTPAKYRRTIVALSRYLKVLEQLMSANEWTGINYSQVPSQAMKRYRKAFSKRDAERFVDFLGKVEKGEAKINAGAITPVDIVGAYTGPGWEQSFSIYGIRPLDRTLEAQWKAIPMEIDAPVLCIADTSGSMHGRPMAVAVSLAIFTAERNKGPFKNVWMNFSTNPSFQYLEGDTLCDRMKNIDTRNWHGSTDIDKALRLVLNTALSHNVPEEDMPKMLVIISDMQFNCYSWNFTAAERIRSMYRQAGYDMPTIMWWNVRASHGQPVTAHETGMILESGASQSALQSVLQGTLKIPTPYEHMLEVLNGPRYQAIWY